MRQTTCLSILRQHLETTVFKQLSQTLNALEQMRVHRGLYLGAIAVDNKKTVLNAAFTTNQVSSQPPSFFWNSPKVLSGLIWMKPWFLIKFISSGERFKRTDTHLKFHFIFGTKKEREGCCWCCCCWWWWDCFKKKHVCNVGCWQKMTGVYFGDFPVWPSYRHWSKRYLSVSQ